MVNQFAKRASLKKVRKRGFKGFAYITATFNNTFINITDEKGNSLLWSSAGGNGFKGAKKRTPFAAQSASEKLGKRAYDQGIRQLAIIVKGPGRGREAPIRALHSCGLQIVLLKDVTPFPHNGCRPPKRRRV
jgi:small subunit ribosomal protein S11